MKKFLVILGLILGGTNMYAQTTSAPKSAPLHIEASLGAGTAHKDVLPFEAGVDLNYSIVNRLSLHAIGQTTYFMPKNGITSDYNRAFNVGGGVGYTFSKNEDNNIGNFNLRVSATTTVGSCDLKNTSLSVGVYWYEHSSSRKICPVVGVGYNYKNFSKEGIPNYNGAYFSFGLRF